MDSSIRSRQTGHVGSSIRDGVGGAIGFVLSEDVATVPDGGNLDVGEVGEVGGAAWPFPEGVNGSLVMSGKDDSWLVVEGALNSMDLTKTT